MNLVSNQKFKDDIPTNTVERLETILKDLGVEVVESWSPVSTIGTYSLRLSLGNTKVGSNGKGMTKEYAKASAYAEFLERLQNMKMQPNSVLATVMRNNRKPFFLFKDETILSSKDLIAEKNSFLEMFLKRRNVDINQVNEAEEELKKYQKMDYNLLLQKDQFICYPYYSVRDKKVVHVPYFLMNLHYGSNGMCAGNSAEEALVQGFSEIYERAVQKDLMKNYIEFPDVPEEYLKTVPSIYKMYQIIKSGKTLDVVIKDCSYGGRYPVVAIVLIEKNTGKFGIKLGSHPDIRVAIERLFTEATQGIEVEKYAKKTKFDFMNRQVGMRSNIVNSFKTGDGYFPHQMISNQHKYEFSWPKDITNSSNSDLLHSMVQTTREDGYDILVRDVSYLGFPSYHMIVPGYSEMNDVENMTIEAENTRFHMQPYFWQPKDIDDSNINIIISVIKYYMSSLMENSIADISGYLSNENYPAKNFQMDNYYYLTMCYLYKGDYESAIKQLQIMEYSIVYRGMNLDPWLSAVKLYAEGMSVYKDHKHVMEYLEKLFDQVVIDKLHRVFDNRQNIFTEQYASVTFHKDETNQYDDTLDMKKSYMLFEELCLKYKKAQENRTIDQMDLKLLFR